MPNRVVIFREGADQPRNPLGYAQEIFRRKYKCDREQFDAWRVVGVRESFDTAFAAELHGQLKRVGQMPDFGPVTDSFEGRGPDGRIVVAFFFGGAPAEAAPTPRATLDTSNPVCTLCGKALGGGESILGAQAVILSARPAGEVQDDCALFTGSICFNCRAVLCVDCLKGRVDQCPKCQGATKPAYRRHLRELASLM